MNNQKYEGKLWMEFEFCSLVKENLKKDKCSGKWVTWLPTRNKKLELWLRNQLNTLAGNICKSAKEGSEKNSTHSHISIIGVQGSLEPLLGFEHFSLNKKQKSLMNTFGLFLSSLAMAYIHVLPQTKRLGS